MDFMHSYHWIVFIFGMPTWICLLLVYVDVHRYSVNFDFLSNIWSVADLCACAKGCQSLLLKLKTVFIVSPMLSHVLGLNILLVQLLYQLQNIQKKNLRTLPSYIPRLILRPFDCWAGCWSWIQLKGYRLKVLWKIRTSAGTTTLMTSQSAYLHSILASRKRWSKSIILWQINDLLLWKILLIGK